MESNAGGAKGDQTPNESLAKVDQTPERSATDPRGSPGAASRRRWKRLVRKWGRRTLPGLLLAATTALLVKVADRWVDSAFGVSPPLVKLSCEWEEPTFVESALGLAPVRAHSVVGRDGGETFSGPSFDETFLRFNIGLENQGGEAKTVSAEVANVFPYDRLVVEPAYQAFSVVGDPSRGRAIVLQNLPPGARVRLSVLRDAKNGTDPIPKLRDFRVSDQDVSDQRFSEASDLVADRWRRVGVKAQSSASRPVLPQILEDKVETVRDLVAQRWEPSETATPADLDYIALLPSPSYRIGRRAPMTTPGSWLAVEPFMVSDVRYCNISLPTWRVAYVEVAASKEIESKAHTPSVEDWCVSLAMRWNFLSRVAERLRVGLDVAYGGYQVTVVVPRYLEPIVIACRDETERMMKTDCPR